MKRLPLMKAFAKTCLKGSANWLTKARQASGGLGYQRCAMLGKYTTVYGRRLRAQRGSEATALGRSQYANSGAVKA